MTLEKFPGNSRAGIPGKTALGKAGAQMGMSRRAGVAGFWKAPRLLDWPFPPLWKKRMILQPRFILPDIFKNEMYIRIFFQVLQPTVTRIYFHPSFV